MTLFASSSPLAAVLKMGWRVGRDEFAGHCRSPKCLVVMLGLGVAGEKKVNVPKVYCESRFTGSDVGLDEEGV